MYPVALKLLVLVVIGHFIAYGLGILSGWFVWPLWFAVAGLSLSEEVW